MKTFDDTELLYAATAKCRCGAGLAYPLDHKEAMAFRAWVCSAALKGAPKTDHDAYDFAFYKIREETSVNNTGGWSTRPPGTLARTVGRATCPKCQHKWESAPYDASTQGHHWFPGPCPRCGFSVGATGSYSSNDGPPIETRFATVVVDEEEKAALQSGEGRE